MHFDWLSYWADWSAGVLASFTTSVRRATSSSLSQLYRVKRTALHWFMGGRNDGYEEQGTGVTASQL